MDFQSPEEVKLTFLLFVTMMIAATFIACTSNAYVPSSTFVFNRVTSTHGRGVYLIEDDATFREKADSAVVHENWVVLDGGEMRLSGHGDGVRVFRLLKKGRVYFVDDSGSERSEETSPDYLMRALLTRTATEEKRLFVGWGVLPPEVLQSKKLPKDVKEIEVATEPFVRLGRIAGDVNYAYGKPAPIDGAPTPGLWIEQDQFVIRKVRTPDGSEALFNDYGNFSKSLSFPKEQVITFDNHTVNIHLTHVSSLSQLSVEAKRQFDVTWLRGKTEAQSSFPKSALGPVVQEFYRRFR